MWELIERWRRINSEQSGNVPHGALYCGGPEVRFWEGSRRLAILPDNVLFAYGESQAK
jgi:hypothetical protein